MVLCGQNLYGNNLLLSVKYGEASLPLPRHLAHSNSKFHI